MKYISCLLFIALAVPECFGQSETGDTHSSMESLHPAQHTVWFGVIGGINYNQYQTASFNYPGIDPVVIPESGESGKAMLLGISCEIQLGRNNLGFLVEEVLYDSKNASFSPGSAKNISLDNFSFPGQRGDISTSLNASLSYLIVATGYKYNFIRSSSPYGPGIQLTIYAGINLSGDLNQDIYSETYPDSKGYRNWQEVTFPGAFNPNLIRLGMRGQISYDIPVSGNMLVTPLIGYDLPFTKVDNSDKSWSASSIFAGIAAHFGIGSASGE